MRLEEWEGGDVIEVIPGRVHSRVECRNKQSLQVEIKSWKYVFPSLVDWRLTLRVTELLTFETPFCNFPLSSFLSTLYVLFTFRNKIRHPCSIARSMVLSNKTHSDLQKRKAVGLGKKPI